MKNNNKNPGRGDQQKKKQMGEGNRENAMNESAMGEDMEMESDRQPGRVSANRGKGEDSDTDMDTTTRVQGQEEEAEVADEDTVTKS